MEDLSSQFLLLLVLLSITVISLFLFFIPARDGAAVNLPPGKTGWPVIGESLEFTGNPEKFIESRMKKPSAAATYSQVFKTSLFGENVAVFCGAAANKFLFSNESKLVAAWWPQSFRTVLAFPNNHCHHHSPPTTKRISIEARSLFGEFLKPESLQSYVAIMDCSAKRHLEAEWGPHKENREVRVVPLARKYTFGVACELFMRIEDPAHVTRISGPFDHVSPGLASLPVNFPGTSFRRAAAAGRVVQGEILAVVRRRKAELSEKRTGGAAEERDLVSRMLSATDEEGEHLSEGEIASMIMGLLIASQDTTSSVITFIIKYLAELPHVYDQVFKEQMEIAKGKGEGEALKWDDIQKMRYSWNVAREAMRLTPPAPGAYREALHGFTYAGFTIPKGWKTHWSVHSTHRDPEYFPNPEKFEPSRFEGKGPIPYSFVPFGGGPRMCPGREFARVEILTFMHNLVTKFKWKKKLSNERIVYHSTSPAPTNDLPIYIEPLHEL